MSSVANDQANTTGATAAPSVGVRRFENKTVIVTGAGSGMGRAVVIRLVAEGASILGIDVNESGLKETVQLTSNPERVSIAAVSITDEQQVTEKVNEYVARQGQLDALINMAGIIRTSLTKDTTLEQFRFVLETNLVGTFLMCRICLPYLVITKGNIVNTASTSGLNAYPYMAAYSASKGAVLALTRSLAKEYVIEGVRVNSIAPGGTATPLVTSMEFPADINPSLFTSSKSPGYRMAKVEEIAGVVAMIASQDGSFINGEVIRIDGGFYN